MKERKRKGPFVAVDLCAEDLGRTKTTHRKEEATILSREVADKGL